MLYFGIHTILYLDHGLLLIYLTSVKINQFIGLEMKPSELLMALSHEGKRRESPPTEGSPQLIHITLNWFSV